MSNLRKFTWIGFLKGFYLYIPILTFFLLSEDVTLSAIVIASAIYSLFTFIGEIPTGLLADRFGQKISIVFGYIIESSGILMIMLFPTAIGFYIASGFRGLAGSFLSGSEEALIYESVKNEGKKNFQKFYGKFLYNKQIGIIISTALAGLVYRQLGTISFLPLIAVTSLFTIASACIAMSLKDYRSNTKDNVAGSQMFSILKESFSLIKRNNVIFNLTIVGVLTLSGEYFVQSLYQPHFQTNSIPLIWVGLAISIGTAINIIITKYSYLLEKYLTLEKILMVINMTLGLTYIVMALLLHPAFIVGAFILMNGLFNVQNPIVSDYINSHVKSSIRTTVLSGISFIRRFFQIFVTLALGFAVGAIGIRASLVIQGAYLIVGMAIGYYLLVRCGCIHKVNDPGKLEFD
ncbi:MAG: MFS transporter [Nanoarchaeota archaeon]